MVSPSVIPDRSVFGNTSRLRANCLVTLATLSLHYKHSDDFPESELRANHFARARMRKSGSDQNENQLKRLHRQHHNYIVVRYRLLRRGHPLRSDANTIRRRYISAIRETIIIEGLCSVCLQLSLIVATNLRGSFWLTTPTGMISLQILFHSECNTLHKYNIGSLEITIRL